MASSSTRTLPSIRTRLDGAASPSIRARGGSRRAARRPPARRPGDTTERQQRPRAATASRRPRPRRLPRRRHPTPWRGAGPSAAGSMRPADQAQRPLHGGRQPVVVRRHDERRAALLVQLEQQLVHALAGAGIEVARWARRRGAAAAGASRRARRRPAAARRPTARPAGARAGRPARRARAAPRRVPARPARGSRAISAGSMTFSSAVKSASR